MKLVQNLSAGVASSVWTAALALAVVPFYIKYMGIESYGLIGFFTTTQALFQIFDMGIVPTVSREIARASASGRWEDARSLLHTLAIIYWCLAGLICGVMIVCSPAISGHWLRSSTLSHETITHAAMLMGLVIACRWPVGLYQAALNGLQRIATSSAINISTASIASIGAVCVLAFVSPNVEAFFLWQAAVAFLQGVLMRRAAWRAIGYQKTIGFNARVLKSVWRFSATMMALAFSGLIFAQLDKVLLSKVLSLAAFGKYMLAGVIAHSLAILFTPFYNAIFPLFSEYTARNQVSRLFDLYKVSGRLLATCLFPAAMIIAVAGEDLIHLWTGNAELAHSVAPLASILVVGTALHGTTYIPYALLLSQARTNIPLIVNSVLLVIMIPITLCLAIWYGALGGAIAWLILHTLYLLLNTWLMHRYIGNATGVPWLLNEVGTPFAICFVMALLARSVVHSIGGGSFLRIACVCSFALGSIAIIFAASPRMRASVIGKLRRSAG